MQIFLNRHDPKYIEDLRTALRPEVARANAIRIGDPSSKYSHVIRIDFLGVSATTLFDVGNNYAEHNVFKELRELLEHSGSLNAEGYKIRLRMLLEYIHSTSTYSRIQAEITSNRASMKEPSYLRNFTLVEQVDKEAFNSSRLVTVQKTTLRGMEDLFKVLHANDAWFDEKSPNLFMVKFTPVNPSFCGLFVNDALYYDVYLMARSERTHYNLQAFAPVVKLTKATFENFDAFEDHFRYLWSLDVTMDCRDATRFNEHRERSLSAIVQPEHVSFKNKAGRIRERNPAYSVADADKWRSQAHRILGKFCTDLSVTPELETAFITCSWTKSADNNFEPNQTARALYTWLRKDFSARLPRTLSVRILRALQNEFFTQQLYDTMRECTIGVVVLSKDIAACNSAVWYSRPNVYHELGYLVSRLGHQRVIILKEKGVEVPSNIGDTVAIDYEEETFALVYYQIVDALYRVARMDWAAVKDALAAHVQRLNNLVADGKLKPDKKDAGVNRLQDEMARGDDPD